MSMTTTDYQSLDASNVSSMSSNHSNVGISNGVASALARPKLIEDRFVEPVLVTNLVVLSGAFSFFGIGANILNMIVFYKQGFKDSMNISLFGLAVSDLACMITMFWMSIAFNPKVTHAEGVPFESHDVAYLTGGFPHECFNRITSFVTVFITLERCLCITLPLKVKTIITPIRTKFIITGIFILTIASFAPTYFVNSLQWGFNSARNRTILSIHHGDNRLMVETVSFVLHSVFMSVFSLLAIIICTIVLVLKLNEKAKWRQTATGVAKSDTKQEISAKETKVVKMVTLISTVFIFCLTPSTIIFLMMSYEPEFSFGGHYHNMFMVAWPSAFLLETINSSINIFIYYNMSSKYKATCMEMFSKKANVN